jgi:CMP-N-acetylneuraminic acid synthetase
VAVDGAAMKILAVIPARCGSTRVPHKNTQPIGGYHGSLVERAAKQALGSVETIVVSTDCVQVARLLDWEHWPDIAVMERQCGPDGPMVDVLLEMLSEWNNHAAVACIQPTSPFRRSEDIDGCIALLEASPEARSVVSVNEATGERNGACYITRVEMLRDGLVFDDESLRYPMAALRSIDINTPEDLETARRIAKEYGW